MLKKLLMNLVMNNDKLNELNLLRQEVQLSRQEIKNLAVETED